MFVYFSHVYIENSSGAIHRVRPSEEKKIMFAIHFLFSKVKPNFLSKIHFLLRADKK